MGGTWTGEVGCCQAAAAGGPCELLSRSPEENRKGGRGGGVGGSELSEAGKYFAFMFDRNQTVPTHPLKSEKLGACVIAGPY